MWVGVRRCDRPQRIEPNSPNGLPHEGYALPQREAAEGSSNALPNAASKAGRSLGALRPLPLAHPRRIAPVSLIAFPRTA